MEDIKYTRKVLRQEMISKRDSLTEEEVFTYSKKIRETLKELDPLYRARNIMLFSSIGNEVDLKPMIEELKNDKTILLPRVEKGGLMEAVKFTDWDNVESGPFGIKEPLGEPFPPNEIDAVIVPGLVFDGNGHRLGYGKGYYDRFLTRVKPTTFLCGVCYEFQVVDNVFPIEGDIPVHWIVTDISELVVNWDFF